MLKRLYLSYIGITLTWCGRILVRGTILARKKQYSHHHILPGSRLEMKKQDGDTRILGRNTTFFNLNETITYIRECLVRLLVVTRKVHVSFNFAFLL